jgi:DNA sulfur modification protein DndE
MANELTLLSVTSADFRTTKTADDLNTKLMSRLGLKSRYEPARLAIARSLSIPKAPDVNEDPDDETGKAILGTQLFGNDIGLWVALLTEHGGSVNLALSELKELVRRHWHRGILCLQDEWSNAGEDFDKFVLYLAEKAGLKEIGRASAQDRESAGWIDDESPRPLMLRIGDPGTDVSTHEIVRWHLNGSGSPHVAIMGTLGSGKTRIGMAMARQIRAETSCPILLFDMAKGDLATDTKLARDLGATVIRAPRVAVPLDVLSLVQADDLADAAIRFRESFVRISASRPGGAQLNALREGALRALRQHTPVMIENVRDAVREVYAETKRRDDTVISTFNDLTSWNLFQPIHTPAEFFKRSWIIDVHEATETAQKFIVFLILDALYVHMKSLPDSALADGNRALRLVLGIDEARKVLGFGHESLTGLWREGRSKGLCIQLMSQSPDDFDSEDDNFLENIGLAVSFRTNAVRPRALIAVLGQTMDLGALPNGIAVTRIPGKPGVVRVKAWK